ncbi:MAG: hypothetical protein KDB03_15185 [Planctomycetales bacterium]|nr:hypothetical protein [Planctomycetales bacterium]
MAMLWPILWGVFMLALIMSVVVVTLREKKARAKAIQDMAPKPLDVPTGPIGDFAENDEMGAFGQEEDAFK